MTTMTEQTEQVYSVVIRATPEQVWDGITKPEFTQRYFHGSVIESSYEPGASYDVLSADRSRRFVDGEVLEAVRPTRLVTTWRFVSDPELAAEPHGRVTWEIEDVGGGATKLTVVHDRLEASPKTAASVASPNGWNTVLSGLRAVLEPE